MPEPSSPPAETVRYPNGNVKFTGSHLDGQMHGPWHFYRADGSLMRAGSFDRGSQVGTWRSHDRTGRVVKETRFEEVSPT